MITSSFEHAVSDTFILKMTYISMSPKVICEKNCEGAKQPNGGAGSPRAGEILHFEPPPKKKIYIEYDFLQIAWGQDDKIEL